MADADNATTSMAFARKVIDLLSDHEYIWNGNGDDDAENYSVEDNYVLLPAGYGVDYCLPASCVCVYPDNKRPRVLTGEYNLPDEHDWRYYDSSFGEGRAATWMYDWDANDWRCKEVEQLEQAIRTGKATFRHAHYPHYHHERCKFCLSKADHADTTTATTTATAASTDCACASCVYKKGVPPYCTCSLDGHLVATIPTRTATSRVDMKFVAQPRVAVCLTSLLQEALRQLQLLLEEGSSHAECNEFITWYLLEMGHYRQVGENGPHWVYIDWPELKKTPEVERALRRIEREKRRQVESKLASTQKKLASTQAQLACAEKKIADLQAQLGAIEAVVAVVPATGKSAAGMSIPQKRKASGEAGKAGEAGETGQAGEEAGEESRRRLHK